MRCPLLPHACCSSKQIWHGRATVYDPTQLSVDSEGWIVHVSPGNIVYHTKPRFYLRSSTNTFSDDDQHVEYDFQLPKMYKSNTHIHELSGQPWLLHMVMDDPAEHWEFYFGINEWNYTAYMTNSFMQTPAYVAPGSVCACSNDIKTCTFLHIVKLFQHRGPLTCTPY